MPFTFLDQIDALTPWQNSVRVATTANITLSGTQTIDGVSLSVGDLVLVKNQTTAANCGIYVVASGVWSRYYGANADGDLASGQVIYVREGTTNGKSIWILSTVGAITLGTTSLSYNRIGRASQATAGTYGSASQVPVAVLNDDGTVSSFTNTAISIGAAGLTGLTNTQVLFGNGSGNIGQSAGLTWNGTLFAVDGLMTLSTLSGTPTKILGLDSSFQMSEVTLGTGLSLSSGAITLDGDLVAVAGLSSNGIVARTASNTFATRTISFVASNLHPGFSLSVIDGNGVAGSPILGLDTSDFAWKQGVRVATTANIATLSGLLTIDGVTVSANDRVLVKDQTTASQNGIYLASSGSWGRALDANTSGDFTAGLYIPVREGTANASTVWQLTTTGTITVGTTSLAFTKVLPSTGGGSPAGTTNNLQYYDTGGVFGADANITVTPGANPKLGIGTSSPLASVHAKSWTDTGVLALLVENSSGNDIVGVYANGYLKFGDHETLPRIYQTVTGGASPSYTAGGLTFEGNLDNTVGQDLFSFLITTGTITSGALDVVNVIGTFAPTSGTAAVNFLNIAPTINQTGGANGATYGMRVAPVLTAAADWVSVRIENTTGKGLVQTGSSVVSSFAGNLGVGGTTSPAYPLDGGSSTSAFRVPVGSTAQRPTGAAGLIRLNSDANIMEWHDGTDWQSIAGGSGDGNGLYTGSGTVPTSVVATLTDSLTFRQTGTGTTTKSTLLLVDVLSSNTPAAGFGGTLALTGKSSTTNSQSMGKINWGWYEATHSTRKSNISFSTIEDGVEKTDIFSIGYNDATSGGSSAVGTMVKSTVNFYLSTDGAGNTPATARKIGMGNFSTGEAALFQFGDPLNSVGTMYGGRMLIQSYWGVEIMGSTQAASPTGFTAGASGDPSLSVLSPASTRVVLSLKAAASQSGNLFQMTNSSNTVQTFFDSAGLLCIGSTSKNASAALDIISTTKGFGLPTMTSSQRGSISSPRDGLLIYNNTDHKASLRANSAWVNLIPQITINAQTGTTYTLVLSDQHGLVTLNNASAITCTVPPNSSVAFPIGIVLELAQLGAGQVTVSPGSGVTINSSGSKTKTAAQYAVAKLTKTATDTWLLSGDIST